jgi:hypothetical protein
MGKEEDRKGRVEEMIGTYWKAKDDSNGPIVILEESENVYTFKDLETDQYGGITKLFLDEWWKKMSRDEMIKLKLKGNI